jgi:hypothetical protein
VAVLHDIQKHDSVAGGGRQTSHNVKSANTGGQTESNCESLRNPANSGIRTMGFMQREGQLLAGHRTGIKDHYVKRNPTMVADCCSAIEQQYFGK